MNWIRSILALVTVTALVGCSRTSMPETQSLTAPSKNVTTPHDAKRVSGRVVEEYPLVYPEWEYDTKDFGCPYRFSGIKVTVENNEPIYVVTESSALPNRGNTIIIESSSFRGAKLGTLGDISVYHVMKLKYQVVVN